ncbi:hypothetical protein [uncultured Sphingomonas sp.]|uniref:hypothetical protein n=1 Tax=uncultured Sphingomonas sp. TaxID=158754 RepID=UPI0035CA96E8
MTNPHPFPVDPSAPDQQPVVDAFTDVPEFEGQRPTKDEVDTDDMFVQGGE